MNLFYSRMWRKICIKKFSTNVDQSSPLPFKEIPGPRPLPVIGTIYNYLPIIGSYSQERLHWAGMKKLNTYGPLVREEINSGLSILSVYKPEDYEVIFRLEGRYPERRSHLAMAKYREDHPEIYSSPGLLPTNGPDWWRIRQSAQKALSRPQNVRRYLPITDGIVLEFINKIPLKVSDFLPILSFLYLELTCMVAFDERISSFNFLTKTDETSRAKKLINAAFEINSCVMGTDNGLQLWKYIDTPLFKRMKRSLQYLESVAIELVCRKQDFITKNGISSETPSILEQWLSSEQLNWRDLVGLSADLLLAGVDTTTFSTSMFLYHLATNPQAQEILFQEAKQLLPTIGSSLSLTALDEAKYAKATLKESLRLNPISIGVGRIISQDIILSGYNVPKGTVVVTQNQVSCRMPEYFDEPHLFIPERWIKGHPRQRNYHPYLSLPFGHGPRSCIARRFAEQNMLVFIIQLVRHFEIHWTGEKKVDIKSFLINKPDKPISLLFTPRRE